MTVPGCLKKKIKFKIEMSYRLCTIIAIFYSKGEIEDILKL